MESSRATQANVKLQFDKTNIIVFLDGNHCCWWTKPIALKKKPGSGSAGLVS